MDARIPAANNAAWCDLVCRAAGLRTVAHDGNWSATTRSPDAYPDAVTLQPGTRVDDVLAVIDDSAGASVKDSFADLDLAPHGYEVLFEADWLTRAPGEPTAPELPWRVVDATTLPRWLAAHGSDSITPGVPADPAVRLLLASDADGPIAVAALNRSGTGPDVAIGVSNVQAHRAAAGLVWSDLVALARRELGPHPLVGYEAGDALAAPVAVGFETVGRLRVWVR
ncbi:hypothetical protein [Cellulomonas fengjieae]|uniref:Uncharacterized protein n=1 Tax=Cellulomonas fengjieae TaxID=2819978 RepID=A0ABS3SFW0_9CELL|nr:hypothetical protein [Cellulomonas fengjieae]MBO3084643.1 hypothetical protein [Cellulomonas fengjieae]MBO3103415.1 hypothetical protein [Cellulomonas fengjieae]QVI67033.1 hypothetical protein KG102_05440 [Cellulomonas fengjieae]